MQQQLVDRRSSAERRSRSLASYWHGARVPRRRDWRRGADASYPIIDWHSPRVFFWVMSILLLCVSDGVLTVMLLANGAVEVNPLMAQLVPHRLYWFATVKLLLTALGLVVLVTCSRMKLFRVVPGELLLALILAGYAVLVTYELSLLEVLTGEL